jgi:hypothetical protein
MTPKKKAVQVRNDGRTVVGLFREYSAAEAAIRRLKAAGFSDRHIGVAVRDRDQQRALAEQSGALPADEAALGAVGGGVLGGIIGLLAGVGVLESW